MSVYLHAFQSIKAVSGSNDGAGLLLAYDQSRRLLFKHGQRVASILVEDLPSNLAGLIGSVSANDSGIDDLPAESPVPCDDIPTWEVVGSVSQPMQLYEILPDLLVSQNVEKVSEIMATFSDIPELLVLNIIEMLFVTPDEKFGGNFERLELLARAFVLPVNDTIMVQHLRQVDFSSARKMLSALFDVLESVGNDDDDAFERLLLWIGMVLNAHYTNFVMSRDDESKDQLTAALTIISQMEASLQVIGNTLPLIKMIAHKQLIRPAVSQKVYNIEIVDL